MKRKMIITSAVIVSTIGVALFGYLLIIMLGNYVIDEKKLVLDSASTLVDEKGNVISSLFVENREPVSIDEVPEHVQEAFVAVEDKRFYEHHGIDVQAIGRALYKDLLSGSKVEGGSTITQQLAKNLFLSNEKTLLRKTKEVVISINLENRYSKEKLLEMYMNQVYFGHGMYGIQAAANYYFNKNVKDLSVSEGALLAALPKAPSTYSPILNPEKSKERRDVVLSLMEQQDLLTPEEVVRAQGKTLGLSIKETIKEPWLAPYIDLVMEEAEQKYAISNEELMRGGYTIVVPLNEATQKTAYEMFKDGQYFPGTDNKAQGAFVLLDNQTGGVLAAIGGRDYVQKGYNRVNKQRQPGSTFKPLAVYGPAMEEDKFTPYSLLKDEPLSYGSYSPRNYDGKYEKEVTMFDALIHSKNAAAVWTMNEIGIETGKEYLKKNGLSIEDSGLALSLGGLKNGVSPLKLANAYRTFAKMGAYNSAYFIKEIKNQEKEIIAKHEKKSTQVFSQQTAWNMTRMLEGVVNEGTAKAGSYLGDLAGKTGTTSYPGKDGAVMDAWFVGYTPEVTGSIWMGYDQTTKDQYLVEGSRYPTRLFKDILTKTHPETNLAFEVPDGVKDLEKPIRLASVDSLSASYSLRAFSLITVSLRWDKQEDERVIYRIYEKDGSKEKLIGEVEGEGEYDIPYANVFNDAKYKVVPYNTQTKKEGPGSQFIEPSLFTSRR
ncbi:transglycosylase domain-containing protein [Metabacillus arenae]|uniref:PBP1A family penicillin-binding protein n=1 Tax=Metabacillus arenae TaxID=2771434 RepID=A0A926NBY4_9BACI|nr:PBP1A family penicillin-binding protein [Metabacillus arenae]MBD1380699.1 PBP1A family penicillin-binding protein [Metabacillus arenae]